MILKLNSYNFKLIFFSLIEKYSLSILQIIAILLITHYFGFISLGIIGSFSLIVSVFSGISEFGGSYGVIRSNKLSPIYITSSLFFFNNWMFTLYHSVFLPPFICYLLIIQKNLLMV